MLIIPVGGSFHDEQVGQNRSCHVIRIISLISFHLSCKYLLDSNKVSNHLVMTTTKKVVLTRSPAVEIVGKCMHAFIHSFIRRPQSFCFYNKVPHIV